MENPEHNESTTVYHVPKATLSKGQLSFLKHKIRSQKIKSHYGTEGKEAIQGKLNEKEKLSILSTDFSFIQNGTYIFISRYRYDFLLLFC
jgi:hypothetical protein